MILFFVLSYPTLTIVLANRLTRFNNLIDLSFALERSLCGKILMLIVAYWDVVPGKDKQRFVYTQTTYSQAIHALDVVHADIRRENVLVAEENNGVWIVYSEFVRIIDGKEDPELSTGNSGGQRHVEE